MTDFRQRIQGEVSKQNAEPDEAANLIQGIAGVLGIEPLPAGPVSTEESGGRKASKIRRPSVRLSSTNRST